MQSDIRDAALRLGYIDARPVTGHPFDVWNDRLQRTGRSMPFGHDPAKATKWPRKKITLWVAIAPTPPMDWPVECGEIGAFYMCSRRRRARLAAWEDAAAALGYKVKRGVMLPERAAAIRAGLGVHGLNGPLIAPGYGSFVDIAVLVLRAAPPPDARGPEHDLSPGCGDCGKCIEACPAGAISANGVDTRLCLRSYMNRLHELPEEYYPKMERRILGCDACQLVCPKNAALARKQPPADMLDCMKLENLLAGPDMACISKYVQLDETSVKAQAVLAAANTGRRDLLPLVESLIDCKDETLRDGAVGGGAIKRIISNKI